ncbi:hypothetical protein UCDDS831_g00954 [Diplodia seriata]|uniref:Uncharacterized protein n=1 Tax=Diplodia seriata TaxID=420778 RepID=A0A0G2HF46_9PEZI|nr:hypothetical protein UCDDS831_g00954 [Diplodia seriata]
MATTSAKPPCSFPAIARFQVKKNVMPAQELIGVFQPSSGHDSCALMAQVAPAEDSSNIAAAIRLSLIPSTTLDDSSRQSIDIIFTVNNIRTLTHHVSSVDDTSLPKFIKKEARKTFADKKRQNVTKQELANNVSNLSLTLKQPPTVALPRNVWPLANESEMSRVRTLRSLTRCTSVMLYFMRDDVVNSALYNFSIAVHSHRGGGGGAVHTAPTHVILNGLSDAHWDRYRVYHRPAVTTTAKRKNEEGSDDLLNGHSSKRVKQEQDKDELDSGRHATQRVLATGLEAARAGDEETFKETMADVFMRVCEQGGGIKKEEADDEPQAG